MMEDSNKMIHNACLEIADRYPTIFNGTECFYVEGPGFRRDYHGFKVLKKSKPCGSFLLTDELLEDETVDEILQRLEALGIDGLLRQNAALVIGNKGIIE